MENLIEIKTTPTKIAYDIKNAELTVAKAEKAKSDQNLRDAYAEVQNATQKVNNVKLEQSKVKLPQADGTANGIQAGLAGTVTTVTATPKQKLSFEGTDSTSDTGTVDVTNANKANKTADTTANTQVSVKAPTPQPAKPLPKPDQLSTEIKYLNNVKEQFKARLSADTFVATKNATDSAHHNAVQKSQDQQKKISVIDKAIKTYEDVMKKFNFAPGEFKLEVVEKGGVDVNYVGGFTYVPPESDPDYEEKVVFA
jgi:hypothetical protein